MARKALVTTRGSAIENKRVQRLSKLLLFEHPEAEFHHGRVGWKVGSDPRLTDRDVRVYWAMGSTSWETNIFSLSTRWIQRNTGGKISSTEASRSQERLEACGYIERVPGRRGQKGVWMILSPIFASKRIVEGKAVGVKEIAAVRAGTKQCGRCGKRRAAIGTSGICPDCLAAFGERMAKKATA